jgi:hypothetical protein
VEATRREIEAKIAELAAARGPGKTICPSDVARALAGDDPARYRPLMPDVREAAAGLADRGELAVTQRGEPVDPLAARGPIRIGLPDRR